jgi:hypothetical protein
LANNPKKAYSYDEDYDKNFYKISYYLKDAIIGLHCLNNSFLLHDGNKSHLLFYTNILNQKSVKITFKDYTKLHKNDIVITSQQIVNNYILQHHKVDTLEIWENILKLKIKE